MRFFFVLAIYAKSMESGCFFTFMIILQFKNVFLVRCSYFFKNYSFHDISRVNMRLPR